MRKLILIVFVTCFATQQLFAQVVSPIERILLPIFAGETPGAFGSRWKSELWIYNDNDEPAGIGYLFPPDAGTISPKSSRSAVGDDRSQVRVITVLVKDAARLHFNLRIRDLSRQMQTAGTEIPVVRESDLRSGKVVLANVPVDGKGRQTLRLYQLLEAGQRPGSLHLRFFRIGNVPDVLFHEETVTLVAPDYSFLAYAQFGPIPTEVLDGSVVRIEIEPLSGNMKYWGFVTVTNNETQHVTTISPQ